MRVAGRRRRHDVGEESLRLHPRARGQRGRGPTAELEILRGYLSHLLLEATAGEVEHRYGDHRVEVRQDERGVDVVTAAGRRDRYDLLLVAEGRRSGTRDLVFGGDAEAVYRDRGQYVAYGTIERVDADDDWWQWLTAADSRVVSLRPDNVGSMLAAVAFPAPSMGVDRLDVPTQLGVLRERFAGVGWQTPRLPRLRAPAAPVRREGAAAAPGVPAIALPKSRWG